MSTLPIEDMSKTYLEHSMVIHNFVIKIGNQIKDSLCRVFGDSVRYQWRENDDKTVTETKKEELQLVMFPNFKITFDELFDIDS